MNPCTCAHLRFVRTGVRTHPDLCGQPIGANSSVRILGWKAHPRDRAQRKTWKPTGSCISDGANTRRDILGRVHCPRGCAHVKRCTPHGCAHTRPCRPLRPARWPSQRRKRRPFRPKLGYSRSVWAPSSRREPRKDQQAARPLRSGPCCPCFRASITRRPRAPKHEMAVGGGAGRGDPEQRPLPTPGKARRPAPLRRRTARRASPRSLRRAPGHKGLEGKHGARPPPTERLAVRSGLERTTGAGAGLAGTARWGAGWGVGRRSFPSPRPASTAVTASRAEVGRSGQAGRRRRARGRRADGREPPFSVARPNGGSGCFFPGAEGTARLRESQRPSLQLFCSVRAR